MQNEINLSNISITDNNLSSICECLEYAVASILYYRSVYPDSYFKNLGRENPIIISDKSVFNYVHNILDDFKSFLIKGSAQTIVLALVDTSNDDVLERWSFSIEQVSSLPNEIIDLTTFLNSIVDYDILLPSWEAFITFRLLIVTDIETVTTAEWIECDPHFISSAELLNLKPVHVKSHIIRSTVSYFINF